MTIVQAHNKRLRPQNITNMNVEDKYIDRKPM
jgi:hypothetical protein